jgi:hypothetical protein
VEGRASGILSDADDLCLVIPERCHRVARTRARWRRIRNLEIPGLVLKHHPGMTGHQTHLLVPAPPCGRVLHHSRPRGRGECRAPGAPAASCAEKSTRVSHHGRARIARHSRTRLVLTASFALSPETGLIASVADRSSSAGLASASGCQDHTTSPSAFRNVRLSSQKRPPHPAPNVRDDRETPLIEGGDGAPYASDFSKAGSDLFLREAVDRQGNRAEGRRPARPPRGLLVSLMSQSPAIDA